MNDTTTFFLAFLAVFGALGAYLWRLERKVDALQRRLEAATTTVKSDDATAETQ